MNVNDYCKLIKDNPSLRNKDDLIEAKDLRLALSLVSDSDMVLKITESLRDEGIIQLKGGEVSFSPVQRKIKEYFDEKFPEDLFKTRKTSFSLTEDEVNDYFREEDEGICILNANGQLIRQKTNQTNVTEKRIVDANAKLMKESTKNLEQKSK